MQCRIVVLCQMVPLNRYLFAFISQTFLQKYKVPKFTDNKLSFNKLLFNYSTIRILKTSRALLNNNEPRNITASSTPRRLDEKTKNASLQDKSQSEVKYLISDCK